MLRAHVHSFLQTLNVCLLVRFSSFRHPQINVYVNKIIAEVTPKQRERSERAKSLELFDFVCHVCCGSWWKLKILINHLNL